jgi:hypothetical protein
MAMISWSRDGDFEGESATIMADMGMGHEMVVGQENRGFPETRQLYL